MQTMTKYPKPERPSGATALEMAIYNYELKAQSYHNAKCKNPTKEKLARLEADYLHLKNEKRRIKSVVIAQTALAEYRRECGLSSADELLEEEHHPTNDLAKYLSAVGEPKPTNLHEAHHIISGKGRYNTSAMMDARLNLHLMNIGINDPHNGIWLINFVKNKAIDWSTTNAPPHRKIHRYNYETWIGAMLGESMATDKTVFLNKLRNTKMLIRTGMLPARIFEKKDELWKGI